MKSCLIQDKKTLEEYLEYEKEVYFPNMSFREIRRKKRLHWKRYQIWKCMYYLRKSEFFFSCCIHNRNNGIKRRLYSLIFNHYIKRKNIACDIAGIELRLNYIGKGVDIWHGGVVINGTIGENCCFHGTNTIGIKANDRSDEHPKLGNRVDVGVGAMVIGNVTIADDCIIGAGAVVTKSCLAPGTILVGVPARPSYRGDKD